MLAACVLGCVVGSVHAYGQSQQRETPTVVSAVAPYYPPLAYTANVEGDVIVEVRIKSEGSVIYAQVISGHPLMKNVSEEAARGWRFVGATNEDVRIARLMFSFRLTDRDGPRTVFTPIFLPPYKIEIRHERFVTVDMPAKLGKKRNQRKPTRKK